MFISCSIHLSIEENTDKSLLTNIFKKLTLRWTFSEFYIYKSP